jgi:hypothetical protein
VLPLAERLKSKLWKTRQLALNELIGLFSLVTEKNDEILTQYLDDFPRLASDSNLMAQEKALEAFFLLTNKANLEIFKTFNRKDFMKIIIEKGYITGKPNIKEFINNIISFFFIKIDKSSVIEVLLESLPHKNQKVFIYIYIFFLIS